MQRMTVGDCFAGGAFVLVDEPDAWLVRKYRWRLNSKGYAYRKTRKNGRPVGILLHRQINVTPIALETDHINGDKLDNRRKNLRSVTRSQNHRNRPSDRARNSHPGVIWDRHRELWRASIRVEGRAYELGRFAMYGDAVAARICAEARHAVP